jgi:Tol biopolymer transport system component
VKRLVVAAMLVAVLASGCIETETINQTEKEPPEPKPKGVLVSRIPETADVIFSSARHLLDELECLDASYEIKERFIHDPDCNRKVYHPAGGLASPRQLWTIDIETGAATQITNMDYDFTMGQVLDASTLFVSAAASDTDGDGALNDNDKKELYILDLTTGQMDCLTDDLGFDAINNPDYSPVTGKIVFSARSGPGGDGLNHIYTIDPQKDLGQLTDDPTHADFDCSWSEDGSMVVFNRLPKPLFESPSQVWTMASDGANLRKVTEGGGNPNGEEPHGVFPIGLDADPDLSPDNTQIVFSRLRTGKENEPFGVFQIIIIDLATGEEEVLDNSYANMVPEWKSGGILFIRQVGGTTEAMSVAQGLCLYVDGRPEKLEGFPFDVFPIGAMSASWVDHG